MYHQNHHQGKLKTNYQVIILLHHLIHLLLGFLVMVTVVMVVFFLVIKPVNALLAMARKADLLDTPPAPPVAESKDVELLREIRDLLKSRPL